MTAKEHYDHHLGNFYAWMIGEFQDIQSIQESFFKTNAVLPKETRVALDLGCGNGLQTISLAQLGFAVEAVDFNRQLLRDLEERRGKLSIHIHEQDMLEFLRDFDKKADVITCMGDTLTHLPTSGDVEALIRLAYDTLADGGKLILSYRDLSTPLEESQRFIPVRSNEKRIHTCFLEYFSDHVKVYDILHERDGNAWNQTVSWYPKLRLKNKDVEDLLQKSKFKITVRETINRMLYLIAEKQNG